MFGSREIPHCSQYLEISYPAEYGQLSNELSGDTFHCVFGTNQSPLEALLLERKIKGPCWLDAQNASELKIDKNLHYTRGITPKRVTSSGAHLRGLVPGQRSSEETWQRWRHCPI